MLPLLYSRLEPAPVEEKEKGGIKKEETERAKKERKSYQEGRRKFGRYYVILCILVTGSLPVVLLLDLMLEIPKFVLNFPIFNFQQTIIMDSLQLFDVLLIFEDLHIFTNGINGGSLHFLLLFC